MTGGSGNRTGEGQSGHTEAASLQRHCKGLPYPAGYNWPVQALDILSLVFSEGQINNLVLACVLKLYQFGSVLWGLVQELRQIGGLMSFI